MVVSKVDMIPSSGLALKVNVMWEKKKNGQKKHLSYYKKTICSIARLFH